MLCDNKWLYPVSKNTKLLTWHESLPPLRYPAHIISSYITTLMPLLLCHLSHKRLSMTGTSTACNVFGLSLDPAWRAPHPAAQPYWPRKSSFFSGRQIGAMWGMYCTGLSSLRTATSNLSAWKTNKLVICNLRNWRTDSKERKKSNLWSELKVRMDSDLANSKCIGRKWLYCWVDDVIT